MGTLDFSFAYLATDPGNSNNISIDSGPLQVNVQISFGGPTLDVGEAVTITGGLGLNWEYTGYADDANSPPAVILARPDELNIGDFEYLALTTTALSLPDTYTASDFNAVTYPFCLLAGSLVLTPLGERRVEDLRPGDVVETVDGEPVQVRWIGRQSRITALAGRAGLPVTIRGGALGDGVPAMDLHVSGDHALLVDGYLVNAQALVNGTSILPMPDPPAQLDYYHVELDRHRVIVANGTPVESFVDDVTRRGFDNYDEWVALGLAPLPAEPIGYLKV